MISTEIHDTLSKTIPIYTVVDVTSVKLNPYKEFVVYCANEVYPKFKDKFNLSLLEFKNLSKKERNNIMKDVEACIPGLSIKIEEKTSHPRIFLEAKVNDTLCEFKFYTYLGFLGNHTADESENKEMDEHISCEITFSDNECFDYLNIDRQDNVFDFVRDDKDKKTFDMFVSFLYAFCNFTDFIKMFKAKSLVVKNIDTFANKFIAPYVQDMFILYCTNEFVIGSICGDDINKQEYSYNNYLASVKDYAEQIKARYGEKYKIEKEENQSTGSEKN